ncbi:MAG: glycosyltransferase family 2 protein [Victivallaceae bacterium]|nr:glycosyltransferase family 2 protein [Victivallaceae bacterium]
MKFSIITPVLNGAATIERTIESVLSQRGAEIEYIVIDGGSTDGTLEVIDRYRDRIAATVSRPDRGLYDAMNSGIALATGEVVGIINSDDYYFPGAFAAAADILARRKSDDAILWGDVEYQFLGRVRGFRRANLKRGAFAPHPSMFVPLALYKQIGGYDISLRYLADYDFMYRAVNVHGVEVLYCPQIFAWFAEGGLADRHVRDCLREELTVKLRYGQPAWLAVTEYWLKLLKNRRRIRG